MRLPGQTGWRTHYVRNRWIDQLRQDYQRPPADLWQAAIQRGHTGATLQSSTTTR